MDLTAAKALAKYLRSYKLELAIVLVSLCSVSLSLLALGYIFRHLVDHSLRSLDISEINKTISVLFITILFFAASSFFRSYYINNIASKVINKIRIDIARHLLKMEILYFEELKIGDILTKLTSDLEQVSKLITNSLSFAIRNLVMLVGALILMFIQSPKLSLITIATISFLLLPLIKFAKKIRSLSSINLNKQGDIASSIEETLSNIRSIYAFNQQASVIYALESQTENYLKAEIHRIKSRSLFFALAIGLILSAIVLVIWVGSGDIISQKLSSGRMISFIYYAIIGGLSAGGIAELFSEIQSPLAALRRAMSLFEINLPSKDIIKKPLSLRNNNPPSIEFEGVTFSYPSRANTEVLDSLSVHIAGNKFIGIVGKSGSGKSTLLQLLLKFYHPNSGIIKVNGQDISLIDSNKLRELIAYVPQEPSIFSGSVLSNITFSKPDATKEEIDMVVSITGIDQFAKSLKHGLDTKIGQKGSRLSGGQKQRIAIARALLYNPQILLLDEATSALDSQSEQSLLSNISSYMKDKLIISVAHRISSLSIADQILVFNEGKISEAGTHKTLLVKSKIYKILCKEQMLTAT